MNCKYIIPLTVALVSIGCSKDDAPLELKPEANQRFTGGANFTSFDFSLNAFGAEGRNLTFQQSIDFAVGNAKFDQPWVVAPASVKSMDGLGPFHNAISCGTCHFKDGRSKPPSTPQQPLNGLLFRLSIPGKSANGGAIPEPTYGGQLQDKAILDFKGEAQVEVSYTEMPGQYPDGETYSLRKPNYRFHSLQFGEFHANMMYSPRIAPQMMGLGLLENVPEASILEYADENDSNKDNISGKANYVWNAETKKKELGRFGWKANKSTIKTQVAGAFNGDMGLTTSLFPKTDLTETQRQKIGDNMPPSGGDPEVLDVILEDVTTYSLTLAVPAQRDYNKQSVLKGKQIFESLDCIKCHRPKMKTGIGHRIAALDNQTIRPYTDLLLHDMGDDLADNRPDFLATGNEWRTPPLWGIGLIPTVNKHQFLLHDGRARNVEEAILWHGGEAENANKQFKALTKEERELLIEFVNTL